MNEILDRTIRIETKLTKLVKALGFDPGGQQAVYDPEEMVLHVPSKQIAVAECLAAIPAGVSVEVRVKDDTIGFLEKDV